MTITSVGYGGYIASEATWSALSATLGSEYGVQGASDWKVTSVPSSDRTVSVAVGGGWGKGTLDTSDATAQPSALASVSSGARYDLVVARRDWSGEGGTTTFAVVTGTSNPNAVFSLRKRLSVDLTQDDQPLALVRVDAGSTNITSIEDVRCWQANAGAVATSERVLQYLTKVGTQVTIGTDMWTRTIDGSGNAAWRKTPLLSPVSMFDTGFGLTGTPPANTSFLMQSGTSVVESNDKGYTRLTFPTPFPNGLLSWHATNGDDSAGNAMVFGVSGNTSLHAASALGTRVDIVYRAWVMSAGALIIAKERTHRLNWVAYGW